MDNKHLKELDEILDSLKETNRKLTAMAEKYGIKYDPNIDVNATLTRLMEKYGIEYDPNYDVRAALERMLEKYQGGDTQ
ncbi:hypothetical protein BAG01nite_12850 [Brevibacillus agri]|uniref:Unusual protein kinase regulating ubiquinone biosynthesis (AarF/ABC1/UbiB family) n=2 Tax=Brevibacillus TaxID=55080 RepID=A0A938Y2L9_9BACL|nr:MULTISPECIES: hypothetical protein [Brevibacillus]MBM7590841.1 putative unusual protein kinase regulating ubiquinone biosynthesis (AarF/ABC1/UbiB family) [Brevibacillus fulvus]QAV13238.1 hypothetical protein BA6348_11035 [Brevibacillus agri]RNB54122.1 hypothetical protein EB820_14510 [Brevibacillus agri]GED25183.1 hypothetical protein BAG01nite_12850 [Brevibacillus agri]